MPLVTNGLRADPTRTSLERRRFIADLRRRFAALKKDVWEFMVTQDALGLGAPTESLTLRRELSGSTIALNDRSDDVVTTLAAPQPGEFRFRTSAAKVQAFRDWLNGQIQARVLSPARGESRSRPWTARYIDSAYRKGRGRAFTAARGLSAALEEAFTERERDRFLRAAFNAPELLSKVELLATRAFEDLRGVTAQMSTQMNRILAQGIADGKGPVAIAREMNKTVDGLTKKRALVIARTEVVHAHAEGQLDGFEELGIDELGVLAEWSTAGDDRVCPQCEELEGKTFTVEEARGMIPVHPQCRCAWTPKIPEQKKRKRRKK